MHNNYVIFYGNLCYVLNKDTEQLYILRERTLAAFTHLKPTPFLLRR